MRNRLADSAEQLARSPSPTPPGGIILKLRYRPRRTYWRAAAFTFLVAAVLTVAAYRACGGRI